MQNKKMLEHSVALAQDTIAGLDKNTRLSKVKIMPFAPVQGNFSLKEKNLRLINDKGNKANHESLYRESLYQPSAGYCGVYAVSYYTGIRFDIVFNYMYSRFNRGGTWEGSSTLNQLVPIFDHFGCKLESRPVAPVTEVRKVKLDAEKWYLIQTRKHFFLYHNGFCIDQTETRKADDWHMKHKHIKTIHEITPKPTAGVK